MSRSLRLEAPSSAYSEALVALDNAVDDVGARVWLGMVDAEWGLLVCLTRSAAEKRKETKETPCAT
jgi:hypothetical protein